MVTYPNTGKCNKLIKAKSVYNALRLDIIKHGRKSRFVYYGKGIFGLREWKNHCMKIDRKWEKRK